MHFACALGKLPTLTLVDIDDTHFILEHDIFWHLDPQAEHVKLDMLIVLHLLPVLCSNTLVWL